MDVYTARDLRNRSGELLSDAKAGELSLITKHGRPALIGVPFDKHLIEIGLHKTLALNLFDERKLTLAQSAKLADMDLHDFMDLLGEMGIKAVDYPAEDLDSEMLFEL